MRRQALVLGAGSYVLGDSWGSGVVLPTLLDEQRKGALDDLHLVVRSPRDARFQARLDELGRTLGLERPTAEGVTECVLPLDETVEGLDELPLDEAVAFVSVPDAHHARLVGALLERGVPTWVVKPLCGTARESAPLVARAAELDVPLWVDYHKRFDVSNRKLRGLVQEGTFGGLDFLGVQYSQPWNLPLEALATWSREVDVFQYIGCHYVDLVFYLCPTAQPLRVSATGVGRGLAARGGPRYDRIHAQLDFDVDGAELRADFLVGWNDPVGAPAKSHQRLEAGFARGRVIADQKERGFEVWSDERFDHVNPYFFQVLPDPVTARPSVEGYGPESLRSFLRLHDDREARASDSLPWARQALRTDHVLDLVRISVENGGAWVDASSVPAPQQRL